MTLISKEYQKLNSQLHQSNSSFGASAWKKVDTIYNDFIKKYSVLEVLDYGCGKGTLKPKLIEKYKYNSVIEYDPCHPKFQVRPDGDFDGVICTDVLEHIERDYIDNVLKDIYNYGRRVFYFSIGLCLSAKKLPDGRNAHILIENSEWWKKKLEEHGFQILDTLETEKDSKSPSLVFYRVIAKKRYVSNGSKS